VAGSLNAVLKKALARNQNPNPKILLMQPSPSSGPSAFSLLRLFAVDATKCLRCGSSLRILSVITQPEVIEGILHHLDLPTAPPSSSRAPPAQVDLPWDDGCM
jgi:hypothetical protein